MVENLLNFVCKAIVCSQVIPVVLRKAIKDKDGNFKGNIEIFQDEEVIDAVVRFIRKSKLSLDEIALKNYMFRQACGISHCDSHEMLQCSINRESMQWMAHISTF